jgi:hypothetical protein
MNARVWGAHAPPRAGDDVLAIANLFSSTGSHGVGAKAVSAMAPKRAREPRALPIKVVPRHLT